MRRRKFEIIAERLARRLTRGDYHGRGIPSERDLAASLGVSHKTMRKAAQLLVAEGILDRLPNGRLRDPAGSGRRQVALLAPAFRTPETDEWHAALTRLSQAHDYAVKLVYYFHSDDPVIHTTIAQFDCSFFLAPDHEPAVLAPELRDLGKPFFVLNNDWSRFGIPSVLAFPPRFVCAMLDHLAALGCRRIDCLNVQPGQTTIPARISQWRQWRREHGIGGRLFDCPVEPYEDPMPAAYRLTAELLQRRAAAPRALFCMTHPAAFGAMRALVDHGLQPGVDVAVASSDAGIEAEYSIPTLTSMARVDVVPFLKTCFQWLDCKPRRRWTGPLLLQPRQIDVVIRQSTVPDIDTRSTPERREKNKGLNGDESQATKKAGSQ